ncbi:MAG: aminotransferase class I/II-fold pyridoxal phosphate-dependent enzyme, partial [Oscillochloris sp.]|nr:aminotransferase class I/II-fold pyridoxal phosphate-dependent enzyme [Oscillochloris sp.]
AHASRLSGAEVIEWCAHETQNFTVELELDHIAARIAWLHPRLTWLCTPNNPTGVDLPPDAIVMLAETCAAVGGLLVVDRAYGSFLRGAILAGDPLDGLVPANVLRLYSLTKSYAIAGLRLGYLLAEAELIGQVAAFQPTWSVSSAALAAGLAALADDAFLSATLPQIWACSDTLRNALVDLGLSVHRADLPFMLVRSGDAVATRLALIRYGCVVRDCTSFGLPAWVRVAPRRPAENARLIGAWKECL